MHTNKDSSLGAKSLILACRGCLAQNGEMKNMFEWRFSEQFYKITDIKVKKSDGLTELLCTDCEKSLRLCYTFRNQCQQSDVILRSSLQKQSELPFILHEATETIDTCKKIEQDLFQCVFENDSIMLRITPCDIESKENFTCPYKCKEYFSAKGKFFNHLLSCHKIEETRITMQYYCPYPECLHHIDAKQNRFFSSRKLLNQHFRKVHKKKTICFSCNEKFPETQHKKHIQTCNVKYTCGNCNKEYKTNDRLQVHIMRKHPELHKKRKRKINDSETVTSQESYKKYYEDSPKRTLATQTFEDNMDCIKNDVSLAWGTQKSLFSAPSDAKSSDDFCDRNSSQTQTVFEDLLSLRSQNSEDESIFFSETVSLSDIQTQTWPLEFGLSKSGKETITSETQTRDSVSPDLSIKETQTCLCLFDSPKAPFPKLFDSVTSSPSSTLTSTETQTAEFSKFSGVKSDVLLSVNSAETQTSFDENIGKHL